MLALLEAPLLPPLKSERTHGNSLFSALGFRGDFATVVRRIYPGSIALRAYRAAAHAPGSAIELSPESYLPTAMLPAARREPASFEQLFLQADRLLEEEPLVLCGAYGASPLRAFTPYSFPELEWP